jgi:hypothetical protein
LSGGGDSEGGEKSGGKEHELHSAPRK